MSGGGPPDDDASPPAGDVLLVHGAVPLAIPRSELTARATRAGGPGGQHVNTSSTRIELLWNPTRSHALDGALRSRLIEQLASRLDGAGNIRVVSAEHRSQLQNRQAAEARLAELVRKALVVPKPRKKTKPTKASKERRLEAKKQRGEKKKRRSGWEE